MSLCFVYDYVITFSNGETAEGEVTAVDRWEAKKLAVQKHKYRDIEYVEIWFSRHA